MKAQLLRNGQQSPGRDWVVLDSTRNRSYVPTGLSRTKLLPLTEECENMKSTRSSISFTVLSEERLQEAVELAKRDLRRRRFQSLIRSPVKPSQEAFFLETSDIELLQEHAVAPNKGKFKASSPKENRTRPGAKQTSQKHPIHPMLQTGQSPPTRGPGPRQVEENKQGPLSQEIHKLQNELEVYIQKVEELAKRGEKIEEPLEPEELNKLEILRQKQAARTARTIYVLQQQVKAIQDDIEKLHSQKMWDTKKSTAINRLAAAHRGAVRALQVVIHQLSDLTHSKVPPHYKELVQLIRQLSLCSAKIKLDQGSAVPETALHILQKLETLDSALSKQVALEKMQAQACPPYRKSPYRRTSPTGVPKGPGISTVRETSKPANPKRGVHGRRMISHKPKTTSHQPMTRRVVLRASLESLNQQKGLTELHGKSQANTSSRKGRHSERRKADIRKHNQRGNAGFQQPTVSSRLRVSELPQRECSVPWIPTSPHSPPPHQSPQRGRPEPRCLFSPVKPSPSSPKLMIAGGVGEQPVLSSEKKKQAHNEALRQAWLDKMTMQRLKELNQLSKEEAERIQRLRSDVISPTQWAERAEHKARERIQPLLDKVQLTETAKQPSKALLGGQLEDSAQAAWVAETDRQLEGMAQCRLQAPTVESMLLRMEEIQRDQEEVRRRFASITYSDPLYCDQPEAGPKCHDLGFRPASPQPFRLTRPVLKQSSAADIVLEKPVDTGFLSESSLTEEASQNEQQPRKGVVFPSPGEKNRATCISVPGSMLRSIRQYREDYESYLHTVAHKAVGSFNPWAITNSMAEELLSEALADVAAEFQDVVEEYAEAVYTSEFLQPAQSPLAS
ncbi:protein moonraker isoform X2 [Echeneis naucrates]|uniref:protein moonraker isoform X2 n=1 Tax=Echeneis naucrates TaxID=173247 RepID=UPI00111360EF|nr:protein moonraker isoform X2 [Echeneis naucrates]